MRLRRASIVTALLFATMAAVPAAASADACAWSVAVLPLPDGVDAGSVTAADGDGWLAGVAGSDYAADGVVWRHGQVVPLGRASGMPTRPRAVNQNGVVVGEAQDDAGGPHAVRYSDGQWEQLEESGYPWTSATDVNLTGDIAGYQRNLDATPGRFVVWAVDGVTPIRELPLPSPNEQPQSVYLDDDGVAAGYSFEFDGSTGANILRGYVWTPDGTRTQLAAPFDSQLVQVNGFRDGRIVGAATGADGLLRAAEWRTDGQFVRFFPGGAANGVNRAGMTLGSVSYFGDDPVVWQPDGTTEPLPVPDGDVAVRASAINDEQVGGSGSATPLVWTRVC